MAIESLGTYWNSSIFVIGALSAFALKFLEYRKLEKKKSFLLNWGLDDYIYILGGGLFTLAVQPENIYHAIIFGASWESLFVRIIKGATNEDKKNE